MTTLLDNPLNAAAAYIEAQYTLIRPSHKALRHWIGHPRVQGIRDDGTAVTGTLTGLTITYATIARMGDGDVQKVKIAESVFVIHPTLEDRTAGFALWPDRAMPPHAWNDVMCLECAKPIGRVPANQRDGRQAWLYRDHLANGHDREWDSTRYAWDESGVLKDGTTTWWLAMPGTAYGIERVSGPTAAYYTLSTGDDPWDVSVALSTHPTFEQALLAAHIHQAGGKLDQGLFLDIPQPWADRAAEVLADLAVRRRALDAAATGEWEVRIMCGGIGCTATATGPLHTAAAAAVRDIYARQGIDLLDSYIGVDAIA